MLQRVGTVRRGDWAPRQDLEGLPWRASREVEEDVSDQAQHDQDAEWPFQACAYSNERHVREPDRRGLREGRFPRVRPKRPVTFRGRSAVEMRGFVAGVPHGRLPHVHKVVARRKR